MNAYEDMLEGVRWVLKNQTAYRVAKNLGINARTINRYQNGETPIENMTLATAEKIYNYYLKEMGSMFEFEVAAMNEDEQMNEVREKVAEHEIEWDVEMTDKKPGLITEITFYKGDEMGPAEELEVVAVAECQQDFDTGELKVTVKQHN